MPPTILSSAADHAALAFFDGVADIDRERIASALDRIEDGDPTWRATVQFSANGAVYSPVDYEIRALGTPPGCRLVVVNAIRSPARAVESTLDARDRWETAFAAASLGVIEYEVRRRLIHMDAAAAAQHGLPHLPDEPLPLDSWLALYEQRDRLAIYALLESGVPEGESESVTAVLPALDQKSSRVLEIAFRTASSKQHVIGASRDVTRERSREELRRDKLTAERATRAKSEFMSQVSHELRTPLNAVLGFAQMMSADQESPLPEAQRARLDIVHDSGRRLLGLIDQLLQIGKIEQGRRRLRAKSVHVLSLISRCADIFQVMAREREVSIEFDIEKPETSALRADPAALEQVLTNLISNAIKYNRDQGKVLIRFRADSTFGQITVIDTGKGLTDSQLGRLFEPFNRLAAERSPVQGTGLGMVITRQLVQSMGGHLDVSSQIGTGSQFTVQLPLGRQRRPVTTESVPLDAESDWDASIKSSVLYVEDDEVNQLLMQQLFSSRSEWELVVASTGAQGIALALRQSPQAILLDMNLPDMSGSEVFKHLKKDPRTRDIPCIAVSADALPEQVERAKALGFDDYWTKPLNLATVVTKLKKALREPLRDG